MPATAQPLGFGQSSLANAPLPASEFTAYSDKEKRRETTGVTDYIGSMYRQDQFTAGLMATIAGDRAMNPDPNYNPFKDPDFPTLSKGIPEEFMPYMWKAHSKAHAMYTADRLREKMDDLQRLDDMGTLGNIGRFALQFLSPENLALDVVGVGLVSNALQSARMANRVRGAVGIERAALVAEGKAADVAARSTGKAVAGGMAFGAAENYAIESLRQSVNFEDSEEGRVMAGVMGGAFTAPFALIGARSSRRLHEAADMEANALRALADAQDGHTLTPEQLKTITDIHAKSQAVRELEAGNISEHDFLARLEESNKVPHERALSDEFRGPPEPDEHFLDRLQATVREQAQEIIQQFHTEAEATTKQIKAQRIQWAFENGRKMREERTRLIEERKARDAQEAATLTDLSTPKAPTSQLGDALKKAFGVDNPGANMRAEKEAPHLQARLDESAKANAKAQATELKKAKNDAWAAHDAAQERQKAADFERAINERELLRSTIEDPFGFDHVAPEVDHTQPTEKDISEALMGQEVTGEHPKTGDLVSGKVVAVNHFDAGSRVLVETADGSRVSMDPRGLDQWPTDKAPEGFLPSSVGAAQALPITMLSDAGHLSSRFTGYSTVPGTNGKVKIPARFDLYAFLNESQNPVVRSMAHVLIKDPVGNKDKSTGQSMTASEWRDHIRRTVGGEFHLVARDAAKEAMKAAQVPFWDKLAFNAKFYEAVSRFTRGDTAVLNEFPQAAQGAIKKASSAQQKAMATMLDHLKAAGVQGADQIQANGAYVNRVWRHDNIRQAIATHGEANVVKLLADSFYGMTSKGPLTGDTAKAQSFLNVVRKLEFSTALQDIHLAARDMHTLRAELTSHNLSPDEIDTLVDVMFDARHAAGAQEGKPGNLKARMSIDETAALQTHTGVLRISDLLENDSRVLVDRYLMSMGGHYGMARVGFDSVASFRAKLNEAINENMAGNLDGDRFNKELQWLNDIQAHITGKPMSMADYSGTARAASAFRGYTRSVTLGQLGLTAAFEMKQAIGIMGMRAFITQLPSFRGFLQALRQGFIPDPGLARQVLSISGHGAEMASAYARAREISEDLPAHILGGAEHWANRVSHAADVISGNASFTSITRQLSAKMSIQFFHDLGEGAGRMTQKVRERLAGYGLEGKWTDDVLADLRTYANTQDGVVKDIRLDDWIKQAPDTYEAFQTFVGRQVRDAIQDHDIGETMPFMHSTLGKMFSELKTFFFVAHAKNMLKNVHYADGTTATSLMFGMLGEAMSYAMQQAINYPDKLEERLQPEVMGPAVMARMSSLGFAPMILDTGYQMATGKSLMAMGSTSSGTNNRNLFMTPSLQVAQSLYSAPGHALQSALGTNPYTGSDFRSDMKTVPLANTYGARGLVNWWANALPTSNGQ